MATSSMLVRGNRSSHTYMPVGSHVKMKIPNLEARNEKRRRKGGWLLDENVVIEKMDNHTLTVYVTGREYPVTKLKSELEFPIFEVGEIVQYRPPDEDCGPFVWRDAMVSKRVPPARINNQWCPLYELSAVGEDLQPTPNIIGIFQIVHIRNKGWRDYLLACLAKDKNKRHDVEMIEEDAVWGRWEPIYGPNYAKEYKKQHDEILESATKKFFTQKSVTKKNGHEKKNRSPPPIRKNPPPPQRRKNQKIVLHPVYYSNFYLFSFLLFGRIRYPSFLTHFFFIIVILFFCFLNYIGRLKILIK